MALKDVTCGVPQESISGPLLFLICVHDLWYASDLLELIIFADDTNLFYAERDIKKLFETVTQWFISNKLSINMTKTKYSFFSQTKQKRQYSLGSPKTIHRQSIWINKVPWCIFRWKLDMERAYQLHWNKIAKKIGIIFRYKPYLNKNVLSSLYYSYIHSHISYANIALGNTYLSNLKKPVANKNILYV